MLAWSSSILQQVGHLARTNTPQLDAAFVSDRVVDVQPLSCSNHQLPLFVCRPTLRLGNHRQIRCSALAVDHRLTSTQQHSQAPADPVVSTAWLAEHLKDVIILDVRGRVKTTLHSKTRDGTRLEMSEYLSDYETYLEGHIPGAIFIDWTQDGIDHDASDTPVQLQTDSSIFAAEMQAKGISTDRPVVVYDSGNGLLAPRIWWSLAYHGHPAPLVLDGGYAKWLEEGRAAELAEPCPINVSPDLRQWHTGCSSAEKTTLPSQQNGPNRSMKSDAVFTAKSQPHRRAVVEDMLQAMKAQKNGKAIILDARSKGQFTGEVRRAEHGGHIPGAVNLTRKALRDDSTGLLRPLHEQRQMFEAAGVDCSGNGSQQIFTYCNGGVASCSLMLALDRLGLGKQSANYDGSWNEWGNDLQLPVEH